MSQLLTSQLASASKFAGWVPILIARTARPECAAQEPGEPMGVSPRTEARSADVRGLTPTGSPVWARDEPSGSQASEFRGGSKRGERSARHAER